MDEKDLFMKSFEEKLRNKLDSKTLSNLSKSDFDDDDYSVDYENFRLESLPTGTGYFERVCDFSEKVLKIDPDKKSREKLEKQLFNAHLNCTATGVQSASILFALIFLIFGLMVMLVLSTTLGIGLILLSFGMYFAIQNIPSLLERKLKSKANDQVIIAIFYIVAFMRFSSNFELAVNFAANYLTAPLSLDFKRILWDLENSKFPNIKAAMDDYLEKWRDDNLEFLEAIYLIESSLYESEDIRRISLLDKALDIILQGNYEKMLHFAQELRTKVTSFNMIGVVLPILGLIILPLAASMGNPKPTWEFVLLLYDFIIPIGVGYMGFLIVFNRPSSVNSIKTPKNVKGLKEMQKMPLKLSKKKTVYLSPKFPALFVFFLFFFIGLLPLIFYNSGFDAVLNEKFALIFGETSPFGVFQQYHYITPDSGAGYNFGPYGPIPGILSLFLPLSIAFGIGYYLKYKYRNLIHYRDKTKKLEVQFPSATFQLGNRINEGIAAELAFGAVAETMKGTEAGVFFSIIDTNIKFEGFNVEGAIFDKERGAINQYPSDLITSSMKILIKALDRGPEITAKTLLDLSRYLTEIHMSSERMKDLLAESLGSMKSQASFLAPIISAVVISIVSLVTMIMGYLSDATAEIESGAASGAGLQNFLGVSIPTYLFQGVVGIYMVMLIIILVYMVTNLENGEDPILTRYEIGRKLMGGLTKYSIVVTLGIIGFSFVGASVLQGLV